MTLIRYEQHVTECSEHDDCTIIVGEGATDSGEFRTESHMHSSVDPSFRLNIDFPDADDRREGADALDRVTWALADDAAIDSEHFPLDHTDRALLAAAAVEKGLVTAEEVAAVTETPSLKE